MSEFRPDFEELIAYVDSILPQKHRDDPKYRALAMQVLEHGLSLESQAIFDGLTGLRKDAAFRSDIEHHLALAQRGDPFTVAFADMGALKYINDKLGRKQGDLLLTFAANFIRKHARHADLAYRCGDGADEFGLILPETGPEGARIFYDRFKAEALEVSLKEELGLTREVPLIFHLGYVGIDGPTDLTVGDILASADANMREDKERNKKNKKYQGFLRT